MQASIAKIVGLPSSGSWAQIHSFAAQEKEKQESHGELIAVIVLKNVSGALSAVEIGREVLARLHEEYFGREEGTVLDRISAALKKISKEFSSLEPEITASVLWKDYVYLCGLGGGAVFLYREGKLAKLLGREQEETVCVSGKVLAGDVFLSGTEGISLVLKNSEVLKSLSEGASSQELADVIAPLVHKTGQAGVAAAVVGITEAEERVEEEILSIDAQKGGKKRTGMGKDLFVGRVGRRLQKFIFTLAAKLPEKGVYVKKPGSGRRTAVSVGVILILLFSASIFFGIRQKGLKQYMSSYKDRLLQAESFYSDSILQKDVNLPASRELFVKSEGLVKELEREGVKDKRLDSLKQKLVNERGLILGIIEAKPAVFYDLALLRSGVSATELVLYEETLAVLDSGESRILSVSTDGKQAAAVSGKEKLGNTKAVTLYSGRYFSFSEKGVVESDLRGAGKVVISPDQELGEVSKMAAFGGNLYLFSISGEIWRYPTVEGGFGTKQRWLGKGVAPESAQGVDAAIDGSIWVLSKEGKIAKFTRGAPDNFRIMGMDGQFNNPTALYTNENLDSLFVLDRENRRVVEIGKDGAYRKQYLLEEIGKARDMAVSKKARKIFLLIGTKILEIPLK